MVLRDAKLSAPLSAERVLVESIKSHSIWQELYESGAFESMEFARWETWLSSLSESEKAFCVRMAKVVQYQPVSL